MEIKAKWDLLKLNSVNEYEIVPIVWNFFLPKLLFIILYSSEYLNCSDYFCDIDHFNEMNLNYKWLNKGSAVVHSFMKIISIVTKTVYVIQHFCMFVRINFTHILFPCLGTWYRICILLRKVLWFFAFIHIINKNCG